MTDRVEMPIEIARDHPAFDGHFPGNPVLPGVVLVSEILAALEKLTGRPPEQWTLSGCKFPRAATPGTALTLAHEPTPGGGIRFEIRSALGVVASGTLAPRART
jgi:3-hydroxymyristoyl/3-hydroxydecanoyl-(acyl carrier protein) dehydratase